MAINFNCVNCGKAIGVPEKMAGRKGKCPACGTQLTVPGDPVTGAGKGTAKTGAGAVKKAPVANKKTQLALDEDPRVKAVLAANRQKPGTRKMGGVGDQDGVATVVDGIPDDADEGIAIPVAVDDDEFGDLPEPGEDFAVPVADAEVVDDVEVFDEDDAPSAAAVVSRVKTGGTPLSASRARAGRAAAAEKSDGPKTRAQRMAEAAAEKKKGGGFLWFAFGLLLAIAHTAGAIIFGVILVLGYAGNPADYKWFEHPAKLLEIDSRIDHIKHMPAAPAPAPDDAKGSTNTSTSN
ncbi:MAG: hypothetical protein AB7K09_00975 [Planctomycetota bacterium]